MSRTAEFLSRRFPLLVPVLRRLFARKVVLMAALMLLLVVMVATVYPGCRMPTRMPST